MPLVMNFVVVGVLAMVLAALGAGLSLKLKNDREKVSPFECGFTPKALARLPFSVRYFLVAIIFLIFDVELILLFPLIPALIGPLTLTSLSGLLIVILVLLLGLSHEIAQGSLSWAR